MAHDLEIIKQIEDLIGEPIKLVRRFHLESTEARCFVNEKSEVTKLGIAHCNLVNLAAIGYLSSLEILILEGNNISSLSGIEKLTNLKRLDLGLNQIQALTGLRGLRKLTWLNLNSNKIQNLTELEGLKNLIELDLSRNQIQHLTGLEELKNITTLVLENNQIQNLTGLEELKNLRYLMLNENYIQDLADLEGLKNLRKLDLENNQIQGLNGLEKLESLTHLLLGANQIQNLTGLRMLKSLTTLDLGDNQIQNLTELDGLKSLTTLILRDNQIRNLIGVKGLKNLTGLFAGYNQIQDLTGLENLRNLTNVDLIRNKIKKFPEWIVELGMPVGVQISGINVDKNPIVDPPMEIVEKGNQAIRDYFQASKKASRPLNEVKVILIGDGSAGKTSLVKRIVGEEFDPVESQTHGINVLDWETSLRKQPIHVHFWDFGGQEIMHATHQFFLSKRCVYILVLDGRRDEKIEYWLKHIESFGGNSPILVALNKIDQNPSFDVNRLFLQKKFKEIRGFFPVSCSNKKGIHSLKQNLREQLFKAELVQTKWPKSWFDVKKHLVSKKASYISHCEYEEVCSQLGVEEGSTRETLVEFLNDLGVFIHFKSFHLQETYVLNPKWITTAVYKIINSPLVIQKRGILRMDELSDILPEQEYPKDKYAYIIELMKRFELCYSMDEATILIPDLLEVQEPAFGFDSENSLKFFLQYDFLPPSILPRFLVKKHGLIRDRLRWRSGLVLEYPRDRAVAVIKADHEARKIEIELNGPQRRALLTEILETFENLNQSFEKIQVEQHVSLPEHPKVTVSYEELEIYEAEGRQTIFVPKLRKEYSIQGLLEGIRVKKGKLFRPIQVTHLEVKNLKCFTELSLDFQSGDESTIILGVNSRGKTTILQMIALGLCGIETVPFPAAWKQVIKTGSKEASFTLQLSLGKKPITLSFQIDQKDGIQCIQGEEFLEEIQEQFLVFAYGVNRHLKLEDPPPNSEFESIGTLFGENAYLKHPKNGAVFKIVEDYFEEIMELVNFILGEAGADEKIQLKEFDTTGFYFTTPTSPKQPIPVEALSDGFKSTFVWLFDLVVRLAEKDCEIKNAHLITGVLLIDEIDLHLHTTWQRRIIPSLKKTFPKVQLIVTTHSPFVAQSAGVNNLVVLEMDEESQGVRLASKEVSSELSYQAMVREVFGISSPFSVDTEEALEKFRTLLQNVASDSPYKNLELKSIIEQLNAKGVEIQGVVRRELQSFKRLTGKELEL